MTVHIVVHTHETATLVENNKATKLVGPGQSVRAIVVVALRKMAAERGQTVVALIEDWPESAWYQMTAQPDGKIEQSATGEPTGMTKQALAVAAQARVAPAPRGSMGTFLSRPTRQQGSLLASTVVVPPAQQGLRGALNSIGMRLQPRAAELGLRADFEDIASAGSAGHCIMVANGKGGSNKTPTTAMISAVIGRVIGLGVAAVDFNESDGTLGWRTTADPTEGGPTLVDLLPKVKGLMGAEAHAGRLASFFHHHVQDCYDVLWSDQRIDSDHILTGKEVDRIYSLLMRYYRAVVIDTGNNVRSENWRAAASHADILVIAITGQEDSAEAAARLLDRMHTRDEHSQLLARNAVAIVSVRNSERIESQRIDRIIADFRGDKTGQPLVTDVVKIPYDPALRSGYISFDTLQKATQLAWIDAVTVISRRLSQMGKFLSDTTNE